jgi:hypothetical protein
MNLKAIKIIGWITMLIGIFTLPVPYDFEMIGENTDDINQYIMLSAISSIVWIGVGVTLILAVRRKEKRNNELQR